MVPACFAHSNPSPGNLVPLDINAACKAKTSPDICCHWAKDCHLCCDVQYMNTNKLETAMENHLVAKDVALAELLVEEVDETPIKVESFVSCSR